MTQARASPVVAREDQTLELCGPCRHFEQALAGPHRCLIGLPLLDGVARTACASFHPYALGEGSQLDQPDCCAHAHAPGHVHGFED